MRNISFFLTQEQFRDGRKTVTRRLGWWKNGPTLKPGEVFQGVVKCQGLKPGETMQRLGAAIHMDSRREPLRRMIDDPEYGIEECRREGFAHLTPAQFVEMFCEHMGCKPEDEVTRIEFIRRRPKGEVNNG